MLVTILIILITYCESYEVRAIKTEDPVLQQGQYIVTNMMNYPKYNINCNETSELYVDNSMNKYPDARSHYICVGDFPPKPDEFNYYSYDGKDTLKYQSTIKSTYLNPIEIDYNPNTTYLLMRTFLPKASVDPWFNGGIAMVVVYTVLFRQIEIGLFLNDAIRSDLNSFLSLYWFCEMTGVIFLSFFHEYIRYVLLIHLAIDWPMLLTASVQRQKQ